MDNKEILNALRKETRARFKETFKDNSRNRIKKIANKKFNTCFIFPISEFENVFGLELWGHGLQDNELSNQQKLNKKRWEQVRRNILDKGNLQRRAFEAEIDLYDMEFKGYEINLKGENDG